MLDGLHSDNIVVNSYYGDHVDNMVRPGMYRIGENSAGFPFPMSYGNILVIRCFGMDTVAQICFPYDNVRMAVRVGDPPSVGGKGKWYPWREVAFVGSTLNLAPSEENKMNIDITTEKSSA